MKVVLNLSAEVISESAKAPKYGVLKVSGKKTLVLASSASKSFKSAVADASKAHKGMLNLNKLRVNLEAAIKKRDAAATPTAKKTASDAAKALKLKIATAKHSVTSFNRAASRSLKVFGIGISVPFSTAELTSPTKSKSKKLQAFPGLKVKGLTGFVTTAKSMKDDKLAEVLGKKPPKKNDIPPTPPSAGAGMRAKAQAPARTRIKKYSAAEQKAIMKNLNTALGAKLKKSELREAKVTADKIGAIKIVTKAGHIHKIAGSVVKKFALSKDAISSLCVNAKAKATASVKAKAKAPAKAKAKAKAPAKAKAKAKAKAPAEHVMVRAKAH